MNSKVLELNNITKNYRQGDSSIEVLRGLDLSVKSGEVVALVGQSGSGKTTLLQIAGLLDNPTSGEIKIQGEDLSAASDRRRTAARGKHLGFIYQFHHLLPEFSAAENVMMPQIISGISYKEAEEKAINLLTELGLGDRASHRPAKLSGGQRQRVAVARAFALNPELILADEPTGNLDPKTADEVFSVFMKAAKEKGRSALVATHNLEIAKKMDRIVHLENGILI
ncbi:MAG: ABC transporter ATP-binding protein [Rickettsiales bacterium]